MYCEIQRGNFTVPISSHWRWCVQPSLMRTVSPSRRSSICAAPAAACFSTPPCRANRMENDVSGTSCGVTAATCSNAWLSVTTMRGRSRRRENACSSASSFVTRAWPPASSMSRIVCCWGRISRPFGADASMGVTSTTRSPGASRSAIIGGRGGSACASDAIRSRSALIFSPVLALTQNAPSPSACCGY